MSVPKITIFYLELKYKTEVNKSNYKLLKTKKPLYGFGVFNKSLITTLAVVQPTIAGM